MRTAMLSSGLLTLVAAAAAAIWFAVWTVAHPFGSSFFPMGLGLLIVLALVSLLVFGEMWSSIAVVVFQGIWLGLKTSGLLSSGAFDGLAFSSVLITAAFVLSLILFAGGIRRKLARNRKTREITRSGRA